MSMSHRYHRSGSQCMSLLDHVFPSELLCIDLLWHRAPVDTSAGIYPRDLDLCICLPKNRPKLKVSEIHEGHRNRKTVELGLDMAIECHLLTGRVHIHYSPERADLETKSNAYQPYLHILPKKQSFPT